MNIFGDERVEWAKYRYFDPETVGLDFKGMVEDLEAAPDGSVVLLHGVHARLRWLRGGAAAFAPRCCACVRRVCAFAAF